MDLEVSHVNLQRGTTNIETVRLDVEETQLTRDHKRQVMGVGAVTPPPAILSSPIGSGSCCPYLRPPPLTSPSICSVYTISPYMHVCAGTAVRGLLPTVFPSAAFSSELPIPNFSSIDTLQEDTAKQPRLSAEFPEFHAAHRGGSSSHADTFYPPALKAHCETCAAFLSMSFPREKRE